MPGRLLTAALSYSAAVFIGCYLLPRGVILIAAAALLILFALALIYIKIKRRRNVLPLISAAAAIGLLWSGLYAAFFIAPAERYASTNAVISARVTEFPREYDEYSSVTIRLTDSDYPSYKCLLYAEGKAFETELRPGDEIFVEVRFAAAADKTGALGGDRFSAQGIALRAYQTGELSVTGRYAFSFIYFPKYIARGISEKIRETFPSDTAALENALLTGDTAELYGDFELTRAMQLTGIFHAVSVSGMHVSFLVGLVSSLTRGRRRATAAVAIPLICAFIPLAGGGAAVVRAGITQIILLTAPLIKREADPLTSLFAVMAALLIINPFACTGVSLQLSFAAMAGIILVTNRLSRRLRKAYDAKRDGQSQLVGRISGKNASSIAVKAKNAAVYTIIASFASTLGASVFTVPLVAVYFGYVSIASFAVNLLTMTAFSLCFTLGYAAAFLGFIPLPLGQALGWLLSWLLRYIGAVVKFFANIPYSAISAVNGIFSYWLVFAYAVVILAYLAHPRRRNAPGQAANNASNTPGQAANNAAANSQAVNDVSNAPGQAANDAADTNGQAANGVSNANGQAANGGFVGKNGGGVSGGGFRPVIPVSLVTIALCCCIFYTELSRDAAAGTLTVADVGQGESVIIISGRSTAVIDCGGLYDGSAQVSDYLMANGRSKIDLLALTHLHSDHAAGVSDLIRLYAVETLCLPADAADTDDDGLLEKILAACADEGTEVLYISQNTEFSANTVTITGFASTMKADPNESGIIYRVEIADFSALVMGDAGFLAERILLAYGDVAPVDTLVVGHHGSKYATSEAFLAAATPKTAIISVGRNSYGHPTDETLRRLENAGAVIYRTDLNGNVTVRAG